MASLINHNMATEMLDEQLEQLLIRRNVRGMAQLRPALNAGYLRRAAQLLYQPGQRILLTTGFPVGDTFESDGPLGALMIAGMLSQCQVQTDWVCGPPLSDVLPALLQAPLMQPSQQTPQGLAIAQTAPPQVFVFPVGATASDLQAHQVASLSTAPYRAALAIERPGKARDGQYYNMRGENISARVADIDILWRQLSCATVAVGDGGNETGMGKIYQAVRQLAIEPAASSCDELVLADVSNWAAYGFAFYWSLWSGQDLFASLAPRPLLQALLAAGCVDGVSRLPLPTEDGFDLSEGLALCQDIYQLYLTARG